MISVTTIDGNGEQFELVDAEKIQWSSQYGAAGGGFGYCKFSLAREVGYDYRDIGFGYRLILYKGLGAVRFDGQIRQIEESTSQSGDTISVTALGWVVVAGDDEFLRAFCDKRLNKWVPRDEIPAGSYQPQKYTTGSGNLGIHLHCNNGKDLVSGDYTELRYDFNTGEIAERFKAELSTILGTGTLFDADIYAIDDVNGYVDYTDDSGENRVQEGMYLWNSTKAQTVEISAINTTSDRITVTSPSTIGSWEAGDVIAVYGPGFWANIADINDAVIDYENDYGEANISAGRKLYNISRKAIATVQSNVTGTNEITVTDESHIDGWDIGDVIMICWPLYEATVSSVASTTVNVTGEIGRKIVVDTSGWVVYNEDKEEYATHASWASGSFDVTDSGDISLWQNGDTVQIFSPFRLRIYDSDENPIWPSADWREGAVPHDRTSIDELTTGSPTGLRIRLENFIPGEANEATCAMLTDIAAYSTEETVTATMLAKEVASLLSASGHFLDSSEVDIATVTNEVEPMVFEYTTPALAMKYTCDFGDENGDLLAWGVRPNDVRRLYLEVQDLDTIKYIIPRSGADISVGGDIQSSYQQVRGIYTDKLGEQAQTSWISDEDSYFSGSYRRKSIQIDNVDTDAEATTAMNLFLSENKIPKRSASYTVRDGVIHNGDMATMAVEDIVAGGVAMIEDWRAVESGADSRNSWTTEQIVGVEIDYDNRSARLIPASAKSDFAAYMRELARIAQR